MGSEGRIIMGSELQSRLSESRQSQEEDDGVVMASCHHTAATSSFHSSSSYLLSLPRDPCLTPQQRSPCLTPHRSPSPRGRGGDCSPQGGLSSPLRGVSPKREVCFRRDTSPLHQLSPGGSLCPRALSPLGHDGGGMVRRELSPRGRQRGMLRAVSPRRGSQHSRAPWEQARGARLDTSPHHGRAAALASHAGMEVCCGTFSSSC